MSVSGTIRRGSPSTWSRSTNALANARVTQSRSAPPFVRLDRIARYLAEATFWVLKKDEPYREPVARPPAGSKSAASSKQGQAPA